MRDTQTNDILLLQRVEKGDRDAFRALYHRYANAVYSVALRVTRDPELAEEVVQDVFMKLWHKHHLYDATRGRFGTWLLSITRFAAIDRLRYENRRFRAADEEKTVPSRVEVHTAQADHDLWELGQHLRMLVERLPKEQRQVVELAYFQGFTHRELAEYLGIPLGTVKSRLRLALTKLRDMWQEGMER